MRAAILALFVTVADAPPSPPPEQPLRVKLQPGQGFVCRSPDGCFMLNEPAMDTLLRQIIEDVRGMCGVRRI